MFKPFALFFFVLTLVWAGSIAVTTDPYVRLHRAALPIAIIGKGTVAVVVQIEPKWAAPTYNFFLKTEHGFKYMLWSVFYEDEWRAVREGGEAAAASQPGPGAASAPTGGAQQPAVPGAEGPAEDANRANSEMPLTATAAGTR